MSTASRMSSSPTRIRNGLLDIAPEATFWIGKRYDRRGDVHIVDTFFVKMHSVGAGVRGVPWASASSGLSCYHTDAGATQGGNRFNAELSDIATNPDVKLLVVGTYTNGDFTGGTRGFALTAQHNQDKFMGLGGGNTLWLVYVQGSAGLNGNFGDLTAPSGAKSWRLVESFTWQHGPFGGQALCCRKATRTPWRQNQLDLDRRPRKPRADEELQVPRRSGLLAEEARQRGDAEARQADAGTGPVDRLGLLELARAAAVRDDGEVERFSQCRGRPGRRARHRRRQDQRHQGRGADGDLVLTACPSGLRGTSVRPSRSLSLKCLRCDKAECGEAEAAHDLRAANK